jgi:PAS domain S-box-containing protein
VINPSSSQNLRDLRSMVSTAELTRRPSRPADHAAENRALVALAQEMAISPEGILQKLAETALALCQAHSAGLSLLEDDDQRKQFHWRAIAGVWAPHVHGGTPRDFGPCGTVLDLNEPLLCSHPEQDFPYFGLVKPLLEEALLVPFYVASEAVGTIWVVSHDETLRFDAEDLRVLTSLATFAAAAYQTLLSAKAAEKANQGLQHSALAMQHFSAIVESASDAIVSKDLNGVITSWNEGAQRIFGYTAEEAIGQQINILIPADRQNEEPAILERIRRGEGVDHYETVRQRKDGSFVDISLTISPIKDTQGTIVGASKIARDITERRLAQERQSLLLREMNHRINNVFAVTSSLVALSARSAATPEEMAEAVHNRLAALTRAQRLTRPNLTGNGEANPTDTSLHSLIEVIFAPYAGRDYKVTGCDVPVGRASVTNIALVLHELATNAAKYGALSTPNGGIDIDCAVNGMLQLTWREYGGPPLTGPPNSEGFGGALVRQIVTNQFGGEFSEDWRGDGLTLRLSIPAEKLVR